jgi:hypothetical protein
VDSRSLLFDPLRSSLRAGAIRCHRTSLAHPSLSPQPRKSSLTLMCAVIERASRPRDGSMRAADRIQPAQCSGGSQAQSAMPPRAFEGFRNHEDTHAVGLPENADYAALDVAITVHVRGLQTGPILVENQPLRIRQINWPSDGRSPTDALGSDLLEHTTRVIDPPPPDASTSRPPTRKGGWINHFQKRRMSCHASSALDL